MASPWAKLSDPIHDACPRQLDLRRISETEVEEVIRHYHTRYADRKGNGIYVGHPGGRRVKVVVAKDSDPPLVIAAAD